MGNNEGDIQSEKNKMILPEYLNTIIQKENELLKQKREEYAIEARMLTLEVRYDNDWHTFRFDHDLTIGSVTKEIHQKLQLSIPCDCVRLRLYVHSLKWSGEPFDEVHEKTLYNCNFAKKTTMVLETRDIKEKWKKFDPNL